MYTMIAWFLLSIVCAMYFAVKFHWCYWRRISHCLEFVYLGCL